MYLAAGLCNRVCDFDAALQKGRILVVAESSSLLELADDDSRIDTVDADAVWGEVKSGALCEHVCCSLHDDVSGSGMGTMREMAAKEEVKAESAEKEKDRDKERRKPLMHSMKRMRQSSASR